MTDKAANGIRMLCRHFDRVWPDEQFSRNFPRFTDLAASVAAMPQQASPRARRMMQIGTIGADVS
jgi:hypothetical protein